MEKEEFSALIYDEESPSEVDDNKEFQANGNRKIYPHYGDNFYNECTKLINTP